jgi:hypothetical protein
MEGLGGLGFSFGLIPMEIKRSGLQGSDSKKHVDHQPLNIHSTFI